MVCCCCQYLFQLCSIYLQSSKYIWKTALLLSVYYIIMHGLMCFKSHELKSLQDMDFSAWTQNAICQLTAQSFLNNVFYSVVSSFLKVFLLLLNNAQGFIENPKHGFSLINKVVFAYFVLNMLKDSLQWRLIGIFPAQ